MMTTSCGLVCLFVYFHQISFTGKDNQINGYNKNKTMTKFERNKLHSLMMMEPKCTVGWPHESQQSTVKVMSH